MKALRKKILTGVLIILLLSVLAMSDIIYFPISYNKLDFIQRYTVDQINQRWDSYLSSIPEEKEKTVGYDTLLNQLNIIEKSFVSRVFAINPKTLGFKGPYFSKDPIEKLVSIPAKVFLVVDENYDTGVNYMPNEVYQDYEKMMQAMEQDLGKRLYVDSAYRSPGYQAKIFFEYLATENGYSLSEVAKWVAMPGFSEHGYKNTAVDFINDVGISGEGKNQVPEDFERLPEFQWLVANAAKFNFYLTYPRDNQFGVNYEPWHWHWEKK